LRKLIEDFEEGNYDEWKTKANRRIQKRK
jgi:hypothetical protein